MKTILIATVLMLSLVSCKKEDPQPEMNKVTYTAICHDCTFIIQTRNEPNKRVNVVGFYRYSELNDLKFVNVTTIGSGKVAFSIMVNGDSVFSKEVEQDGQENYNIIIGN